MFNYRIKIIKKQKNFFLRFMEMHISKRNKLTLPDFLIIGAQKSGTTWLYSSLRKNEDVYFPHLKQRHDPSEIRFFENLNAPLKWYSQLYEENEHKIKGDKSPGYYFLPRRSIQMIKYLMPKVKNILILRNPVERAWSQAVMNMKMFHQLSYKDNKSAYNDFLDININRGFYSKYIKNWEEYFPPDQFKIFLFDDLKKNPIALIDEIGEYIGLQKSFSQNPVEDLNKKVNANPKETIPDEVKIRLQKIYRDEIKTLEREYHLDVANWLED